MSQGYHQPTEAKPAPTHNLEAEQGLLGALLLNNDLLSGVLATGVEAEDFFEPIHRVVFAELARLVGLGRRVTPILLKTAFPEVDIAGMSLGAYLSKLCQAATTAITTPSYARDTLEHALRRRLIGVGNLLAEDAGASDQAIRDAFEEIDAVRLRLAHALGHRREGSYLEVMTRTVEHFGQLLTGEKQPLGISTGIHELDEKTGGLQPGELVLIAGRPGMGKSTVAASLARQVAAGSVDAQTGEVSSPGVFLESLEMGEHQVGYRLLADQARTPAFKVPYFRLSKGDVTDAEAEQVILAARAIEDLPLYIDFPTAAVTIGELSARARGVARKLERDRKLRLRVVVVDYLKFLRASSRYAGQRVYEIGELSAALKMLARDLNLCVVLLAQLNREVEKTASKRPDLSHLRECVVGTTRLIDARTGHWRPIKGIMAGDVILGVDTAKQKIRPFKVAGVWSTGVKPVHRLQTRTGRAITATSNHPFLTPTGWAPLETLKPGDVIATAWRLPPHGVKAGQQAPALCRLLGYFVGDGSYLRHRAVSFISSDPVAFADVTQIVTEFFPSVRAHHKAQKAKCQEADFVCTYANGWGKTRGNPLREWLRGIGVFGQRDNLKRVPAFIFDTTTSAGNFLAGYLSSDGCVKCSAKAKRPKVWEVHFDTVSRQLANDVQCLLLRLGVVALVNDGYASKKATQPIFRINLAPSAANLRRFAEAVPWVGRKGEKLAQMVDELPTQLTSADIFTLPREVSKRLGVLAPRHQYDYGRVRVGWVDQGKRMRRDTCAVWARNLGNADLRIWAESDLLWETVTAISPAGEQEVFDIHVPGCGNFIGDGIVAHNSGDLEADADAVWLLYREHYYLDRDPELSKDAGLQQQALACVNQLDVDVAKQRMGPTGTVKLFCDIATSSIRSQSAEWQNSASAMGNDDPF